MEKVAKPSPGLEVRRNGRRFVFRDGKMTAAGPKSGWYEPGLSASEIKYREQLVAGALGVTADAIARDLKRSTVTRLEIIASNAAARIVAESEKRSPPKGAAGLVAFFAPVKVREQLLGDLEEAYFDNVKRIGPRAAKWSYRYQVAAAAVAFLGPRILAWSGVAAVLKRFGAS